MAATNVIRKVLPYSTLAVAVAAAYSGWIMYSRYRDARAAEERIETAKKDRAIEQRRWVNDVLGDEVKILSFAADPGVVRPGGSVLLCYGVANASTVKMEPPVEGVRPAFTHLCGGVSQEDHELHAHRRRQKRQNGERLAHGGGAVGTALDVGAGAKAFVFTRA